MEFKEIIKMPTVINNNHESLYRSYQALSLVKEMLHRGDSNETILEAISTIELLGDELKEFTTKHV